MTELLARRARLLGPNVPTFYQDPLHIVKGEGVWLWDRDARKYLDCYNNVPHVGHCHPAVVEAIARQAATLNTHTRYLHEKILDYVERLTGTFSHGLDQAIMVCTGSEANDTNIRIVRTYWDQKGQPEKKKIISRVNAYHGSSMGSASLGGMHYMHAQGGLPIADIHHIGQPDWYTEGGDMDPDEFGLMRARELEEAIVHHGEDKVAAFIGPPI